MTHDRTADVRLTQPAIDDLRRLNRRDPQIVRWAFKKMLLLEADPGAGEPLLGDLIGYRKIVLGNRDWRIVWRETVDASGQIALDIAEVWAVGARSDAQVYSEMQARLKAMRDEPQTRTLAVVVRELARAAWGIETRAEPAPEPLPEWLVTRLTQTVGVTPAEVERMTLEQAVDAWTAWISSGHR